MGEQKESKKKNLIARVLSSAVLLAILLVTINFGGIPWFVFTVLIAFGGLYEFYKMHGIEKSPEGIAGYLLAAGYFTLIFFKQKEFLLPVLVLGFLVLFVIFILRYEKSDLGKAIASFLGLIYPVALASYIYLIRDERGILITCLVFAGSWLADVFAWLFGNLLGKHHFSGTLSPKKTWEGVIGGILMPTALAFGAGFLLAPHVNIPHPVITMTSLTFLGTLISIFGDLTASAFKRFHKIKDFSKLIPGHGGVLDRFDSVLFVAPAMYYGCMLLSALGAL